MTKFQKKVYSVVSRIPKGQTMTYKEVAFAIGQPGAYRAVGNALNKNPFLGKIFTLSRPVVSEDELVEVPCHRVVRSDGQPGGYVLGEKKKLELLKGEKALL